MISVEASSPPPRVALTLRAISAGNPVQWAFLAPPAGAVTVEASAARAYP